MYQRSAVAFSSPVNPVDRERPLTYRGRMTSPIAPRQTRPSRSSGTIVFGIVLLALGVASAVILIWLPALRTTSGAADGASITTRSNCERSVSRRRRIVTVPRSSAGCGAGSPAGSTVMW